MTSVQHFRDFVNHRLTAAAEEIFSVFEKTVVEYEQEINRQRRLLDVVWKTQVLLHRTDLPQQHVSTENVPADQQLFNKEIHSSLDQQNPNPPQIKEEQEELCTSQDGEQHVPKQETDNCMVTLTHEEELLQQHVCKGEEVLAEQEELCTSQDEEQLLLKQETNTFMLTITHVEGNHNENQTLCLNPDESQRTPEEESKADMSVKSAEVPETNPDYPRCSHLAERKDHRGGKHGHSASTGNAKTETKSRKRHRKSNAVGNPTLVKNTSGTHKGKKSFICETCGKAFPFKSKLIIHLKIHTGDKSYSCKFCGKKFNRINTLKVHERFHADEKPYSCKR